MMQHRKTQSAPLGIFFMLLGMFAFTCGDALIKDLATRYPINHMLFFRNLFSFIPLGILLFVREGKSGFKSNYFKIHLFRGTIGTLGLGFIFWSFHLMPLADAIAYNFTIVLFITALSGPLLKEKVTLGKWVAILVGFLGVVVMARPTGGGFGIGVPIALMGSFIDALAMIAIRFLSHNESSTKIAFYYTFFSAISSGLTLFYNWTEPTFMDLGMLGVLGFCGLSGMFLLTQGYGRIPASVAGPMHFSAMIWAIILGYIFWAEVPALEILIGAGVIVLSGIYIAHHSIREEQRNKRMLEQQTLA